MPAIVRLCDRFTGHGSFGARPNTTGSGNVIVNRKGAHTVGGSWVVHKDRKRLFRIFRDEPQDLCTRQKL